MGGHEGYITVGLFDDGNPGELFITMAKEGSTIGGLMDTIGTLTSMALQYGVPLGALVKKFTHMRFEPSGWTGNPDIQMAKSVVDYIFRWLGIEFLPGYREANVPKYDEETGEGDSAESEPVAGEGDAEQDGKLTATNRLAGADAAATVEGSAVKTITDLIAATHNGNGNGNGNGHGHATATSSGPQIRSETVHTVPGRRPGLRQLRRDYRQKRQLLPLPQLRQLPWAAARRTETDSSLSHL